MLIAKPQHDTLLCAAAWPHAQPITKASIPSCNSDLPANLRGLELFLAWETESVAVRAILAWLTSTGLHYSNVWIWTLGSAQGQSIFWAYVQNLYFSLMFVGKGHVLSQISKNRDLLWRPRSSWHMVPLGSSKMVPAVVRFCMTFSWKIIILLLLLLSYKKMGCPNKSESHERIPYLLIFIRV